MIRSFFANGCHGPLDSFALIMVPMDQSKLVVVQAFGSQVDANLAKSELASAGIDSMIQADTVGGMRPHIAWSGLGFKVLVREEDAEMAREVLQPSHEEPAGTLVVAKSCGAEEDAYRVLDKLESAGIAAKIQSAEASSSSLSLSGPLFQVLVGGGVAAAASCSLLSV